MAKTTIKIAPLKITLPLIPLIFAVAACQTTPKQYTQKEMQEICAKERAEADGISGSVKTGVSSHSGPFLSMSVSINDKITQDLDPEKVYTQCLDRLSAENAAARTQ